MTSPLHITGCYRSGSTYTALLLNNHPELSVGLHTTNWPRERHYDWGDARLYAHRRWGLNISDSPPLESFARAAHSDAGQWDVAMQRMGFGPRWAEKTNLEVGFQPTFIDWFPDGYALTVLRDPRSILASFREYDYHDPPVYLQAAFVALASMQQARRDGAYWLRAGDMFPEGRYVAVRYEDIARHPANRVRTLWRWMGLDTLVGEDVTSMEGWSEVPGSAWQDRSSFGRVNEDFDVEAAVHRWKGNLSRDELAFVEWVCWDEMRRWGYEPSNTVKPYPMQFSGLLHSIRRHEGTRAMLERFIETGEGTEAFPDDPTDASTWRDSNREAVA